MNNWPTKKLGDLLETCDAGVWGKPAMNGKGLFVLRSTNMTNDGHLDFSDVAERKIESDTKKVRLSNGDILVEKSGGGPDQPVGRVAHFTAPSDRAYSFANFIQRLRVKSNLINSRFLFYRLLFLHKTGFTKRLQSQTTGIRNLKLSLYLKTEIPLPPLNIQKQIVGRLDKIAEAQKLNGELITKTDELFQSLFYNEYEIKHNQWDSKKLQEICKKTDQIHPSKLFKKEFSYIDIASIDADKVIRAQIVSVDKAPSRARKVVRAGDTIFSTVRPYLKHIAYIPEMLDNSIASTGFCVIRPNTNLVDSHFLNYVVESNHFVSKVLPLQRGANYPAVSDKNVYDIKIALPPLEIQKQIIAKLSAVQEYKTRLLAQKSKLKELFDSALVKSFQHS